MTQGIITSSFSKSKKRRDSLSGSGPESGWVCVFEIQMSRLMQSICWLFLVSSSLDFFSRITSQHIHFSSQQWWRQWH